MAAKQLKPLLKPRFSHCFNTSLRNPIIMKLSRMAFPDGNITSLGRKKELSNGKGLLKVPENRVVASGNLPMKASPIMKIVFE